ncbi:hypothetical protein H6G97_47590 [Nostoc flagelliforme FACHB-838]|uniref:Transposase n=1 Tax=Nostoc flagelliforme FACHB-838 TaxID=2692904 RepID=A0ABR8E7C1_9NOSO|nr:hypothetical protein [Nostoc flagelliforme]MBD2536533.1 hypothetical protein [Nostoc flagelliforme FACHB-838]
MEKIGEQKRKIRPDAVYYTEILLTASPEYFRPNCFCPFGRPVSANLTQLSCSADKCPPVNGRPKGQK